MSFKKFYESFQVLDELLLHGNPKSNGLVIAYKAHVWVLDNQIPTKLANEILKYIFNDEIEPLDEEDPTIDSYAVVSEIQDNDRGDVLVGNLTNGELYLQRIGAFNFDPKSSILIKKVVKALKLKNVKYADDIDSDKIVNVGKAKIKGNIPDIAYHGTASDYIISILKNGLEPRGYQSNYKKIIHDDKIFFTTRFGEASHHALHTANQTQTLPVVLEMVIPDKNLMVPDYDIDMHGGQTTYQPQERISHTKYGTDKSMALSQEFGIYGYMGKILPQHIKWIYICFNHEDKSDLLITDYKKLSPIKLRKFVDRYGSIDELGYYIK